MSEREVPLDPEIEQLSQKLSDIYDEVSAVEQGLPGNSSKLTKL